MRWGPRHFRPALAVVPAVLVISFAAPASGAAAPPAAPDSPQAGASGARPWTVEETDAGWRVTLRTERPVPLRNDQPVLVADGRRLGLAEESADARTFRVVTRDPRVLTAHRIDLTWATAPVGGGGGRPVAPPARSPEVTGPVLAADPGARGPYQVDTSDYDLGDEALSLPSLGHRAELRGRVYAPRGVRGQRPVVLFLHGRHRACYGELEDPEAPPWPCPPRTVPVPSYAGYDAAGEALASAGYVVVSVSANAINAWDFQRLDEGQPARGELVLATLDMLRRSHAGRGPLTTLRGRLDLSRVGLMGHSRGGEGVARAALLNSRRDRPYGIRALFLLAPTDFGRLTLPGVAVDVLLPYCDGDVRDLQGQHYLDDTRVVARTDRSMRAGQLVMGANHNYFNREWSPGSISGGEDDWGGDPREVCGRRHADRLSAAEQRAVGRAYIAGFFRTAVGRERAFLPLFNGSGARVATTGRAVVYGEYQAPAPDRLDVAPLQSTAPAGAGSDGARLHVCAGVVPTGGSEDFVPPKTTDDRHLACARTLTSSQASHWSPTFLAVNTPGTPVGHLRWTSRSGRVRLPVPGGEADVRRFDALTMRMAADPAYARPLDLTLRVTDAAGSTTDFRLSAVSPALGQLPGRMDPLLPRTHLRTVRLPIEWLRALDLRRIRTVEILTETNQYGGVYVADVAFTRDAIGAGVPTRLPMVTLTGSPRLDEGDRGTSRARLTVILDRPSRRPIRLNLGASPPLGYYAGVSVIVPRVSRRLIIPAGTTKAHVTVPVRGNIAYGFDLPFLTAVSVPHHAVLGANVTQGLVRDDDPPPTVVVGDGSAREGDMLRFPITQTPASDRFTTIQALLVAGTATYRQDYQPEFNDPPQEEPRVFVAVEPGDTAATLNIQLLDDAVKEGAERFSVRIEEVMEATYVGPPSVTGTIFDDD